MIKATLILLLACCASRLMRKRPAAERHLLWVAVLAAASLLPLLSILVPAWRPEIAGRLASVVPQLASGFPDRLGERTGTVVRAVGIETGNGIASVLAVVWVAGTLITAGLLLPGAAALRRLVSRSQLISDPAWLSTATRLKHVLGLRRSVSLLQCTHGSLPLTWGVVRPQILLPIEAGEWSESRRVSVLAHELAHIRRRDWLFQILAEAACALYWFHPLFWVARNRLHLESERACDNAVIQLGIEPDEYAGHLLDIARSLKRQRPAWSVGMAGQFHLESRLVAILNAATNRRTTTKKTAAAILLPLVALVIPVAAMRVPDAPVETGRSGVIRYTVPPLYSDQARLEGIQGTVTVEARVDASGRPSDLRVVKGVGFGLDENALVAVRNWQFAPGAQPDAVVQVDVEFSLETAELNEMIANDMVTRVGPGVVPPRIVRRVHARSPQGTTNATRGTVLLDAVIDDDGIPRVVRVVRSLSWEFDEAAIDALEQWRFSPAVREGQPVKVRMNVEMSFVSSQGGER